MRQFAVKPLPVAARAAATAFSAVKMGPADPILGLGQAFKEDGAGMKVNLGVGVYRDDQNKPVILECVKQASKKMEYKDMEYAPITGIASYVAKAQIVAFGADSAAIKDKRIASSQSLSGTGALRVAGNFLQRHYGPGGSAVKKILLPKPTWGNHTPIFKDAGLQPEGYTYYNAETKGINIDGMLKDLKAAPEGTMVLLHACAHNPTGMDPTHDEWKEIAQVMSSRNLFPLVDMAYQGFASGNLEKDAFALRLLTEKCPNLALCQSFAKNFGLYGQRTGAVHFVSSDNAEMERVLSQLKILIRPIYSNPPLHGAKIVDTILNDAALTTMWHGELTSMAERMNGIRSRLVEELAKAGSSKDWSHINKQIGMMAFTGMSTEQVATLKAKHHIYMTNDGRAAISGLNSTNVEYVAKAFHDVSM